MDSRWITYSISAVTVMLLLTACDGIKTQIGLAKSAPDEFTVVTKAPLIIPPDFTLRPPSPGAPDLQEVQVREEARRALLRTGRVQSDANAGSDADNVTQPDRSRAEAYFLKDAGADKADPEIREVIRRETLALVEKDSSFTRRLMFWRGGIGDESLVDAEKEAERLREEAMKGTSPNDEKTPVIERARQSLLKRFF
tara:strand:- start:1118 stop:1708 length:591 start_codon:yes stop_codon:yes gene_type:complete